MKKNLLLLLALIVLSNANAQYPVSDVTAITADIPFQGYDETQPVYGQGEYQIFYGADGVLDMPVIITDGYDPADNSKIENIYSYATDQTGVNLFDELRDQNVDIVILNFPDYTTDYELLIHGGADYIERNAFILVKLLQEIATMEEGDQSFMVIGPSMGGLITRYALAYMEQNGMDHHTGLWLSWDSPQVGANIPISLQYLVNYMAVEGGDADLVSLRDDRLNTPAAKQMLLDHYTAHLADGEDLEQDYGVQLPTPAPGFRDNFINALNAVGFPQTPRNIALINGSGNATQVESPGTTIVDTELDLGSGVGLDMELYFTPAAGTGNYVVDYLQPTFYGYDYGDPYYTYAASPATSSGLDSAPGGIVLFDNFFAGAPESDVLTQFYEALQVDAFSFIPTLSALGVEMDNWYTPAESIDLADTAFDAVHFPEENQPHLTLDEEGYVFLNNEVSNHFGLDIAVEQNPLQEVRLLQNPVQDEIALDARGVNLSGLDLSVFTPAGRKVSFLHIDNTASIIRMPAPGEGIYILQIKSGNYQTYHKLIVTGQ